MAEGFVRTLLSLSLSGACLAALAGGMARLLRARVPPGLRRLLWLLVLMLYFLRFTQILIRQNVTDLICFILKMLKMYLEFVLMIHMLEHF